MEKTLSVVISTRQITGEYLEHIRKKSGNTNIQILTYLNQGDKSLAEVYNIGLSEAKNNVVVFCHDDLIFETSGWVSKILKHFNQSDFGILGVAGTTALDNGVWWTNRRKMFGIVNHLFNGKRHTNRYSEGFGKGIKQVVVVDGLFMAVQKDRLKKGFNERFDGFHFYDLPICLENHLLGVKVGVVTDVRLTHKSIGVTNQSWQNNKKFFEQIYKDSLPCRV